MDRADMDAQFASVDKEFIHLMIDPDGKTFSKPIKHGKNLTQLRGRNWVYMDGLCTEGCVWCEWLNRRKNLVPYDKMVPGSFRSLLILVSPVKEG